MDVGKGKAMVVVMPTVVKVCIDVAASPCDFAIVAARLYQVACLLCDTVTCPVCVKKLEPAITELGHITLGVAPVPTVALPLPAQE
jgi:hypothetical protein